jgi:hypothetical protein
VLSTCGDTFLGGEDFDDRVIDLLADEFVAKHKVNLRQDRFALEKLKAAAEQAKKDLSVDEEATIRIADVAKDPAGGALAIERVLSVKEFSRLVADLIQRTFKVCDEALQQANLTVRDLDGVILVGGPTRLPLIRDAVSQYFQREPKSDVDPDQVVAMGAAIHAASLVGEERDSCLLDVTPLSLRIGVAGGLAETVIDRNTPVPIEQTAVFTTFRDFQQSVKIRVYQGESRVQEENELLGEFEFSGFKHARRGEVRIEVTFEIDTDGIVNVTARDPDTGQVASTQIHLSSGLSEEEIQALVAKHQPAAPPPPAGPTAADVIAALPKRPSGGAETPGVAAAAGAPLAGASLADVSLDSDALAPLGGDGGEISLDTGDDLPLETDDSGLGGDLDLLAGDDAPAPDDGTPGGHDADVELRGGDVDLDTSDDLPAGPDPAPGDDAGIAGSQEYELDADAAGGDLELAPPAEPGDGDRTMAIGGEIDLEALESEAAPGGSLAGGDVDLDPLDLDESDLDSLAALADEVAAAPAAPAADEDPMAITRPRPAEPRREEGSLFDDPGGDLSRYQDDEDS